MRTNEELATASQTGDREAINQLWEQCYRFIRQQANRWARAWENRPDFDVEDLTQSGYIALCRAVRSYQQERGPFIGFLAFYLKTEFSKVAGCRTGAQMKAPLNNALSLDAPAYTNSDDNDTTVADLVEVYDPNIEAVEDDLFNQQLASVLDQALELLPDKQRRAIELYYLHGKTHAQAAEETGCETSVQTHLTKDGLRAIRQGRYAPTLSELLYGERNLYKHTSYGAFQASGCSSPEWELLRKERVIRDYRLTDTREAKIRYCMERRGMSRSEAEELFPA